MDKRVKEHRRFVVNPAGPRLPYTHVLAIARQTETGKFLYKSRVLEDWNEGIADCIGNPAFSCFATLGGEIEQLLNHIKTLENRILQLTQILKVGETQHQQLAQQIQADQLKIAEYLLLKTPLKRREWCGKGVVFRLKEQQSEELGAISFLKLGTSSLPYTGKGVKTKVFRLKEQQSEELDRERRKWGLREKEWVEEKSTFFSEKDALKEEKESLKKRVMQLEQEQKKEKEHKKSCFSTYPRTVGK